MKLKNDKIWRRKRAFLLILLTGFVSSCGKDGAKVPIPQKGAIATPTEGQKYLIEAVKSHGAQSANGKLDSLACTLSEDHLSYMISQEEISHDGFSSRADMLKKQGASKTAEIVASNCGKKTLKEAAYQCASSWRNSANHWSSMKRSWTLYCYGIQQSGNCTYCIGLFANL